MLDRTQQTLMHGTESGRIRSVQRLQAILDPIETDFPFRDLVTAIGTQGRAVEVTRAHDDIPPPGELIRELRHPETGNMLLSVFEGGEGIQWHFADLGVFWVDPTGWVIRYELLPGASTADAEAMLLGPVLGIAAQQRGKTLLHASAIVVDGSAVAFSASHGSGKSTLAASFIADGAPLLSDDILPVSIARAGVTAHPYLPRAKLHTDSLSRLHGEAADSGERSVSWWGKHRLRIGDGWGEVQTEPALLRALYLLTPSPDPAQPIEIDKLDPLEASIALQAALYSPPTLRGNRARQALRDGVAIGSSVHVARVRYHRDYAVLDELRARLSADAVTDRQAGDAR